MTTGIYGIYCEANDKWYVGQSVNIRERWLEHRRILNCGSHHNIHLQRAWDKYGETAFDWYILETCEEDRLDQLEQVWIADLDSFNNGFNRDTGGNYNRRRAEFSEAHREKLGVAAQRRWNNPEYRENIVRKLRKRVFTEDHRAKLSKANKGNKSNTGRIFSDEHRANLSKAAAGRKLSPEHVQKSVNAKKQNRALRQCERGELYEIFNQAKATLMEVF